VTEEGREVGRPKPIVSHYSQEFWDGLERDEFLLQRCNACTSLQNYPKPICMVCGSTDLGWTPSSGRATVYTWTTMEANPPTPFVAQLPYTLVIAEMAEGPRFLGRYVGNVQPECGLALRAVFTDRGDGVRLPTFAAAEP
jgi:uncharacterized OB-fold protein